MKSFVAVVVLALASLYVVASANDSNKLEPSQSLVVITDLDRSGMPDSARLDIGPDSVSLLIKIDSKPLPAIEIPIDASQQLGICLGSKPSISVTPQSDAPLNALGETPPGYEICPECVEIMVGGGECDPIHFYWDTKADKLAWWRA